MMILVISALAALPGCGNVGSTLGSWFGYTSASDRDLGEDEPQTLARDAQERMDADDYKAAAELWQQLKDQYPYSKYATLGELKMADALYLQAKYTEALGAYEDFERLHQENEAVAYSVYQQGMCHYQRTFGIDRDQTPTIQAIQTLARLIETYPDSQYAAMGRARIAESQNNLAGHEFYVGEFYYKRKDYAAAMNRFTGLLRYYPDSGYHQRALNYIAEYKSKVAEGEIEEGENLRGDEMDSPFISETIPEPYF
jgi:outer membrane protein assembly factor BamD